MATQDKCCTIVPYFKVQSGKLEDFKALCEQLGRKPTQNPNVYITGSVFPETRSIAAKAMRMPMGCCSILKMWVLCCKNP